MRFESQVELVHRLLKVVQGFLVPQATSRHVCRIERGVILQDQLGLLKACSSRDCMTGHIVLHGIFELMLNTEFGNIVTTINSGDNLRRVVEHPYDESQQTDLTSTQSTTGYIASLTV